MVKIALLFLSLSCPETTFTNLSNEDWNDRDMSEYESTKERCGEKFPNSPCVKKFIKVRPLVYRVICGREE